jgi:hypothetical protein
VGHSLAADHGPTLEAVSAIQYRRLTRLESGSRNGERNVDVSVTPYQSPSDLSPISSGSTGGGGGGGGIPANAEVPQLLMTLQATPDFAPDPTAGSGGGASGSATPVTDDFSIDLASLREGEDGMINASATAVDGYTTLNSLFQSVKDTVFGQDATVTKPEPASTGGNHTTFSNVTSADPIQSAALAFANGQNGQPGMNDVQAYALQQVGNAMAMVGEFIAMLNATGWSYAQADASSTLPSAESSSSSS